jgi:hypothetical protein
VKNAQDLDGVVAYSVRNDVRSTGHNEFAGPIDTAHSAQVRVGGKFLHRIRNPSDHTSGRIWVIACDVLGFRLQVGKGGTQPPKLQR